ncbi:MAG: fatty acid desaturase [Bdellovibrionales bacterium]|nr:fatty acid desaturase [Bdellovibrionales bacterium]
MENTHLTRSSDEPHKARRMDILKNYPQVRALMGSDWTSGLWIAGILLLQVSIAAYFGAHPNPWLLALVAFAIGAIANHALFVLLHEATHNSIYKGTVANRWAGIACNLAQGIPSAMAFRNYHLLHHKHQGNLDLDADLPGPVEAKMIGNHPARKALWLFCFLIIQGFVRPARLKKVQLWNGWVITNLVCALAFNTAIVYFLGWTALAYLLVSTWFAVGLHPLGARWVQEHFVFKDGQETYSYYGPWNKLMFNVGYHNEHHDIMNISWRRLPALRRMAPEYYDTLYAHHSYALLLRKFLFDPAVGAGSRVIQVGAAAAYTAETCDKNLAVGAASDGAVTTEG